MGLFGRRMWAAVDAVLLAYLLLKYDWSSSVGVTGRSALIPVEMAFDLVRLLAIAGCFGLAALAIVREFRREPDLAWFPFLQIARPLFLAALVSAAGLWIVVWSTLGGASASARPADLFAWLTAASHRPAPRAMYGVFGLTGYADGSTGSFLVALLVAAYLAEKCFRLARSVGRPRHALTLLPVVPLLLAALAVLPTIKGERAKRAWVRSQEWAVLPGLLTFPDAVAGCERQGPGWRLPSEAELAQYLGSTPGAARDRQGEAWTNILTDMGSGAVVVGFAPLKRGASPYRCAEETHDPDWLARDGFTRLRGWACGWLGSATRHPAARAPLAVIQASVVDPVRLPAVCIRSSEPALERSRPPERNDVVIANGGQFAELLRTRCVEVNRPPATCAAFAPGAVDGTIGAGVGVRFFAIEQQFEAASVVFEGMILQVRSEAGRSRAQIAVRRYFKGSGPPLVEVEGLPPDAAGLTPQDRRLFFASMQPRTGVLSVAENGVFEVTSETLAAIAPKLGPGAPPPFLSGPRARRGPPTNP